MGKIRQEENFPASLGSHYGQVDEGQIQIGDDVIARIVDVAASEVEGVALDSKFALSDLIGGRKDSSQSVKGVSIEREAGNAAVAVIVSVKMEYGLDMYEAAVRLRKHIKTTVEKMTHVIVRRVDVRIVGIQVKGRDRDRGASSDEVPRD